MQFGTWNRCKRVIVKGTCVGDRVAVLTNEMVCKRDEVIALGLVAAADLGGLEAAIRKRGMCMEIPTKEMPIGGKGRESHDMFLGWFFYMRSIRRAQKICDISVMKSG